MGKFRAYLTLMRPPNLLTAVADILAGFAASASLYHIVGTTAFEFVKHELPWGSLGLACLASVCLYGGGVVLNDYYDAELDQIERKERPIPSGQVSRSKAGYLGYGLLIAGILLASSINIYSGFIGILIAIMVVSYDAITKEHSFLGPLNMGLCRGANLLLGVSLFPAHLSEIYFLAIITVTYIAAITLVSRGEVHGSNRVNISLGFSMYLLTAAMVISLGILDQFNLWHSIWFLLALLAMVVPPLYQARSGASPALIGKAVKFGVLGLILLNATIASGFAGWFFGLLLLLLLPFSIVIAKSFAVT
jgi:4-hydroxybenzoate polyprenyltransferase